MKNNRKHSDIKGIKMNEESFDMYRMLSLSSRKVADSNKINIKISDDFHESINQGILPVSKKYLGPSNVQLN